MSVKLLSQIRSRTKNARDMTIELIQGIDAAILSSHGLSDAEKQELEGIRNELQGAINHCNEMLGEPEFEPAFAVININRNE